jgi:hypothetical protein
MRGWRILHIAASRRLTDSITLYTIIVVTLTSTSAVVSLPTTAAPPKRRLWISVSYLP